MAWFQRLPVESSDLQNRNRIPGRWLALLAVLAVLLLPTLTVLLPLFPQGETLPGRDSGVFLYTGQEILNGKLPYLDVWDHKGPAIYYINAFGLWIAKGASWGVWLIELGSLLSAAGFSISLLWLTRGPLASITATLYWLMTMPLLLGRGNFTEEYALPLQFAALLLFYLGVRRSRSGMLFLFVGLTGGMAFLLRPNILGIWLAIVLYLAAGALGEDQRTGNLKRLGLVFAGALSIVSATILFFALQGAFPALVDATLIYNLAYSGASLADRLGIVRAGFLITLFAGILLPAICSWLLSLHALPVAWRGRFRTEPMVALAAIAFPVEILLTSVSGHIYNHYYLSWLPVLALLTAQFFHRDLRSVFVIRPQRKLARVSLTVLVSVVCVVSILLLARNSLLSLRQAVSSATDQTKDPSPATVSGRNVFPWKSDNPPQYLLMWGAETAYNYWLDIPSPTRYVYQYPLYHCTYTTDDMIDEFLADIVQQHPVIIDTSLTNGVVPPIDSVQRKEWMKIQQAGQIEPTECAFPWSFNRVFDYLYHNYIKAGTYGTDGWPVYVYAPPR